MEVTALIGGATTKEDVKSVAVHSKGFPKKHEWNGSRRRYGNEGAIAECQGTE